MKEEEKEEKEKGEGEGERTESVTSLSDEVLPEIDNEDVYVILHPINQHLQNSDSFHRLDPFN